MKFGYVRLSDGRQSKHKMATALDLLNLADHLGFAAAYLPKLDPLHFVSQVSDATDNVKVTLDLTAFGPKPLSEIEKEIRQVNDQLDHRLTLGLKMCGPDAAPKCKADAQAFETLFSDDNPVFSWSANSRFPMKPPRPQVVGLPMTGSPDEARQAAARGYSPMSPSWLPVKELARVWPQIVAGATAAVRRACPSQWQVNRIVVVNDDSALLNSYLYGGQSPIRAYFKRLTQHRLINGDIDALIRQVVIAGSASKVAEEILSLREIAGQFGTLNLIDPVAGEDGLTRDTMVQLTEDVMPMVANSDVGHLKSLERT